MDIGVLWRDQKFNREQFSARGAHDWWYISYPTMYLPNGSLLIVQDMTKLQMYVEMAVAGMVSQAGSNVLYRPNQCGSINMCIRYMP